MLLRSTPAKLILITGATSGFGEATARRFAAEGHRVIIAGRRTTIVRRIRLGHERPPST